MLFFYPSQGCILAPLGVPLVQQTFYPYRMQCVTHSFNNVLNVTNNFVSIILTLLYINNFIFPSSAGENSHKQNFHLARRRSNSKIQPPLMLTSLNFLIAFLTANIFTVADGLKTCTSLSLFLLANIQRWRAKCFCLTCPLDL